MKSDKFSILDKLTNVIAIFFKFVKFQISQISRKWKNLTRSCQQFKKYVTMPEKLLHNDYIYIDTLFAAKIIVPNQDNLIAGRQSIAGRQ